MSMPEHALNPAESAAAKAQKRVNECIDSGRNFRLEAGAGAGKTYSLISSLKRLIEERGTKYIQIGQKVACITYTQVARDEIINEIDQHPAIEVDTIHAFCWRFMSRFQNQLRALLPEIERNKIKIEEAGGLGSRAVEYSLGFFGIQDEEVTLYHDDVPNLMALLLEFPKFRGLFTAAYPILFIDEYQDTDALFSAALAKHFFAESSGPLIGLFGDHWQTIYRDDFELAQYPNVVAIDKGANFRSVPAVVNVLNALRPELPQAVKNPSALGEARVFHTNAFAGQRTNDRNSKEDLLPAAAGDCLASVRARLTAEGWDFSPQTTKILMLTHNAMAEQIGYPSVVDVFNSRKEAFSKKEDKTIAFLVDVVEPMRSAYAGKRFGEMFHLLGRIQPVRNHGDKEAWRTAMTALDQICKTGTVGQVLDHLKAVRRPRLPDPVSRREEELATYVAVEGEKEPTHLERQRRLRDVSYSEIFELAKFVQGSTPFATQHSVKGAEFENVLVVLGGGWNHYNWPRMLDLMQTGKLDEKNKKGFHRSRNLFYVSLSRPKKRLAVLMTQSLSNDAIGSLNKLFGEQNVIAAAW